MDTQSREDRIDILNGLPEGTRRVKVIDLAGRETYKKPEEVDLDNDVIQFNKLGDPITMRGQPGLVAKLPHANRQAEDINNLRQAHVAHSKLLGTVKRESQSEEVFSLIMRSMAADIASLEFEINEHNRNGTDPSNVITKKAKISKAMADAWVARQRVSRENSIDMESEQFSRLFGFILSTMKEAMEASGTRKEHIETIFNRFSNAVSKLDWKVEAKKLAEGG